MNKQTKNASLTRRTLHYFWQVTRQHLGYFLGLMVSTIGFQALLSYGNPYMMSLIVDKVGAGNVAADEVFEVFGPYIVALILINALRNLAGCDKVAVVDGIKRPTHHANTRFTDSQLHPNGGVERDR